MREKGRKLTQFDVIELFSKAYLKVQTAQIAINGFKCTGIYPFDKNIFQESDFVSEITENLLITNSFIPKQQIPKTNQLPALVEQQ